MAALTVNASRLDGFEGLQQAVRGNHVDIVQLGHGRLHGSLSHLGLDDFSVSIGTFNVGIRSQVATDEKLIIGMLLSADDRVTHWSFDMKPADVLVIPPHVEHDGVFHGASSYAAIKFDLAEVATLFAGERRLSDPASWLRKHCYRALPSIGLTAAAELRAIASHLSQQDGELPPASADFWKRAIADCLAANIVSSWQPDEMRALPSALRLVHDAESYLEAAGERPVHVSEICAALRVPRRTLDRAFHEVFGMGPLTFLRHKRLCAVHAILKDRRPGDVTITDVALRQGFLDSERFRRHYRALFGESPSQTLGLHR